MTAHVAGPKLLITLVIAATVVPAGVEGQSTASDSVAAAELLADAQSFMAAYADDLRRGDRAALGRRYDPAGTRELRPARARWSSHEAIADRYASVWQPPSGFEWRDLVYEVVGPESVLVSGLFEWTTAGGTAELQSYTALLRRQPSGEMVISLEAEAGLPPIPWLLIGIAAAVLAFVAGAIGWGVGRRRDRRTGPSAVSEVAPVAAHDV